MYIYVSSSLDRIDRNRQSIFLLQPKYLILYTNFLFSTSVFLNELLFFPFNQ